MSGFTSLGKKSSGGLGGSSSENANTIGPFGTALVSNMTPLSQGTFVHGISEAIWGLEENGDGSVTASEGLGVASAETGVATLHLKRGCKYRAGQGVMARFTAIFGGGSSGSTQLAGVGNAEAGYFFAMQGESFGILHRERSKCHIESFTLSASATGSITVTLGGATKTFSITSSTAAQAAYLISRQDYSDVGQGWDAESIGAKVFFAAREPGPISGSWGISGISVSATAVLQAGVAPTETFIPQGDWNVDSMNGSGSSRFDLDPTKGNVYGIGYQYLGFGNPVFSIENPETGLLIPCHMIHRAGVGTTTVIKNPTTTVMWKVKGGGTPVSLSGASAGLFSEGLVIRNIGASFTSASSKSNIGAEVPLLTIRPNRLFKGERCYGEMSPFNISIGSDTESSSSGKLLKVQIYKYLTLGGPTNFQWVDEQKSIAAIDVGSTSISSNGRSQLLKSIIVASNDSIVLKIEDENFFIAPGETLTITGQRVGNQNIGIAAACISWFEDQ